MRANLRFTDAGYFWGAHKTACMDQGIDMEKIALVCFFSYLAGSVNFAILFFKISGRTDPRLRFSGNAGTTNVYRQAGMTWAIAIFLLDLSRAFAVAMLAMYVIHVQWLIWASFFLILGNRFPCFHGFRGGKGVANYLGFTALVVPWAALLSAITWVSVYWIKRVPFIASLFMAAVLSIGHAQSQHWALSTSIGSCATFALIFFNHASNMMQFGKDQPSSLPTE